MKALAAMKPPFEGGCLCGAVRYVCAAAPVWSVNCHCNACQKLSGAPFVSAFSVPAGTVEISGETHAYHRDAEAGHRVQTHHCARCGGRVWAQSAGNTALVNLFAATLDDPSVFAALSNVYLSEAAGWIEPPTARFNFPKMPGPPET
ncbi:MAG: glutathione-dependent formaldehyde-activating [Caulobacter sp.]|jgi:hypothetical protein|nr:glutathione-dependent formaldehyde-activating [Caulobacter sp.]